MSVRLVRLHHATELCSKELIFLHPESFKWDTYYNRSYGIYDVNTIFFCCRRTLLSTPAHCKYSRKVGLFSASTHRHGFSTIIGYHIDAASLSLWTPTDALPLAFSQDSQTRVSYRPQQMSVVPPSQWPRFLFNTEQYLLRRSAVATGIEALALPRDIMGTYHVQETSLAILKLLVPWR
jgi:hypothetical protein